MGFYAKRVISKNTIFSRDEFRDRTGKPITNKIILKEQMHID